MKKLLTIALCLLTVLSMSSCKKNSTEADSATSSNASQNASQNESQNTSSVESETQSTPTVKDTAYEDIVCTKINDLQQISFSTPSGDILVFISMPKEWKLKENKNGYSILKNSQTIGSVSSSMPTNDANKSVNVYHKEISSKGIKITNKIDRVDSDKGPSYTRTLCYNYDENKKSENIVLTFNYQEVDAVAIHKMVSRAEKVVAPQKNMGIIQIKDERNKILILGNSFVGSSSIGSILETMCGSSISIEAHSRGMATVNTYASDTSMRQNIRAGKYSVLFMCGLYGDADFDAFKKIIDACKSSNTKLVIFPAHNESRSKIERTTSTYPDILIMDWKAEVDTLINCGIDESYFCIDDSHKHSTPLAGYVGAHMIYRAVFNKIPKNTSFAEVTQSEINLLGEYATTGTVNFLNKATYIIK